MNHGVTARPRALTDTILSNSGTLNTVNIPPI